MKKPTFSPGQRIHIDTDNDQWGRVASDATVLEIGRKRLFVEVDSVRSTIYVPKVDVAQPDRLTPAIQL